MPRHRSLSWSRGVRLLPACSDLFAWHEPAVRVYVSATVPQSPAAGSVCALLTPLAADSQLLARLGGDTVVGKARLAHAAGVPWTEPRVQDHELHLKFPGYRLVVS